MTSAAMGTTPRHRGVSRLSMGVAARSAIMLASRASATARDLAAGGPGGCAAVGGVAGPTGGTEEKPVGHVNMCAIFDGEKVCNEYKVRAVSRSWNRNYTVLLMLNMINKLIR